MRLGFSNRVLASLFHLKNKRSVSYTIHSARLTLMKNFTHHYIGLQHVDRQTVIDHHQTSIASELFTTTPDQLCILMDGTYIYIQKSSYYEMQRRTYSLHKHRHLVKPMMITPSTGYILTIIEPFLADGKKNDASIAKNILYNNDQAILNWLHDDDIIMIDRGFRDAVKTIEMFGFHAAMSRFLNGSKQFSTTDANYSCCITKSRWAIESANGKIKPFKYFNQTIQNSIIPSASDYLHIVCAIVNAYLSPAIRDPVKDSSLVILVGSYQVRQAKSYILEHLKRSELDPNDLEFTVELCEQHSDLIRIRFVSRHSTNQNHLATVQFDTYQDEPIQGWYCTGHTGARVVGCYVHIAALIWYLGVCRAEYNDKGHSLSAQHLFQVVENYLQYAEK
ncbi:unnamed protein product [Rotaria socialis]|uniref:DDE Tnp4 domain-containing protein n=1 Tax=Rotaria socialis TaxID=392032 RepID=A0A818GP19_9BILA|nr:unnamed protein product [Rotaria socialis]